MNNRIRMLIAALTVLLLFALGGCQAVQPGGSAGQAAWIEQMKAEAVAHELGAFDLYVNRDWATLDRETAAEYYGLAVDGSYTERDAALAGLQDEKLAVQPPDLGDIRVLMVAPDAYIVSYPLNFNGVYDGQSFSNPRTVASLWVKRDGSWQNLFLAEAVREGALNPGGD